MVLSMLFVLFICPVLWPISGKCLDYSRDGDIIIAALLPITTGDDCQTENPTGILYAEAVIHKVVEQTEQQNYTVGYMIRDTCESADIAAMAASHLVQQTARNQSDEKIIAVIIDGQNSEILKAIKEKLDATSIPQVLIRPQDFMEQSLHDEITRASSDLFQLLDHSWVAVLGSDGTSVPSFLKSDLSGPTTCMVGDVILSEDNSRGIVESRKDEWERLEQVNLGVVVSGVDRGVAVVKQARRHGVKNKTWVIVTEELKPYHYLKGIQQSDIIYVLSKNWPKVSSEQLINFHNSLIKMDDRPWNLHLLKDFLTDWSPLIKQYPCHLKPLSKRLIQNLNDVTYILNTVSSLRSAVHEILRTSYNTTIESLRENLKHSYLNGGHFKHDCNNHSYQNTECSSEGYTLSKAFLNNTCHRWTFQPVGTWGNSSGWDINPPDLQTLKEKSKSWKCETGFPVQLPRYLDNCLQQACLTCPTDSQDGMTSWANDYCRLCTVGKCSDVSLSYVSFTNPFALLITCLCVLGEVLLILVVLIFAKFRETPVVKSSNRMFNFFTLTTLGFWFAVIPSFLGRPNYFSCNVFMAFFPIVYATVSAIQLSKTVRLLLIFESMQQSSNLLGNAKFFLTTIALILIQVSLSVVNFMVYPVHLTSVLHHDVVLLHCERRLSPISAVEFTYNCLLLAVCGILAYRARKLPQNFNEAKNMSFAIISSTISWTMIILGYYNENFAEQQITLVSLGLAIGAFSVLVCLFFPKVRVIFFYPQLNTKLATREGTRRYSVDVSANIGAIRPPRPRSSTLDFMHHTTRPGHEQRRMSLNNNAFRPRTLSDSSFLQLVGEVGRRYCPSIDSGASVLRSSV